MPVHKSAKTRVRRNARRNAINVKRVSRTRGGIRKLEEAIASGDYAKANAAFKAAQPDIQRSAMKGLLHKKTASRKLSRLSARVKALKKAK